MLNINNLPYIFTDYLIGSLNGLHILYTLCQFCITAAILNLISHRKQCIKPHTIFIHKNKKSLLQQIKIKLKIQSVIWIQITETI